MDKYDFSVSFPDKSSLESCAKLSSLELPLYSYRVQVTKSKSDPKASSVLQCVWIKIYNLSDIVREEGIIREVASLVGKPLVVDELSIIKEGPVRVKVDCRDPSRIKGFIEVFFNKVGYELKVVAEGARTRSPYSLGPSGSGNQEDKDQDEDRNKPERNDEKRGGKFERKGKELEKNQESGFGESQEDMEEDAGEEGTLQEICDEIPIAAFHPTKGLFSPGLKKAKDHTSTVNTAEVLMLNKEIEQKIISGSQLFEVLDN
ncbi:hypothetical protein Zm00014a_019861 [Zea mays]|uniref:DUF4283 domain-containing protein n=1 Tax=Zea mays TaxID=4577 RepID=A0A3L6E5W7_MAIZE|nr:hypothetical protein Zm00014a_019861 [Zea mays]